MKTVVLSVGGLDSSLADFAAAWKTGKADDRAHIGFESWEVLHKVLSPKRLEIIRLMTGAGPLSTREIARRVGRDFKGVYTDTRLLLDSGVIDRTDGGELVFPYDRIRVDFEIPAAA